MTAAAATEADLRSELERILGTYFGTTRRIQKLARRPEP